MSSLRSRFPRRTPRIRSVLALVVTAALAGGLTACADTDSGNDDDTIVIGQTSVFENTDPFNDPWSLTAAGISETVFMVDENGELYSNYIDEVTQVDDLNWTLSVKDGAEFADGTPVDADALAWALNQIQTNNELSNASAGVITFTADGDTLQATTERSTMVLDSVLAEWTNIVYKEGDDGEPVFSGPYQIVELDPGASVELEPNPNYPDADEREDVTIRSFADVDAMRLAIQEGSIDMAFTVTPDVAEQLASDDAVTVKDIEAGYQYFGVFNLDQPEIADPAVREALDLGLNRDDYVTALDGGQVASGLFAHYFSFAGDTELTYDPEQAAAVLDAAGWVAGDDGIRAKDGEQLELSLITYPSRPDLSVIMQIMVSQLEELGIATTTEIVDDISAATDGDDWDIALWAQHTAPTGEPSYFLNQFFRTDGGNNKSGYSSTTTDALLDELGTQAPGEERDATAREIQTQIHADLPVLYLVDPQWHIAVSDDLADYQPYGGDYYVVNAQLGLD